MSSGSAFEALLYLRGPSVSLSLAGVRQKMADDLWSELLFISWSPRQKAGDEGLQGRDETD